MADSIPAAETTRLAEEASRTKNWKRWGPYLSERQWATVREDYSATGDAWNYFPHDHARSRAYRWGEDGLLGWTDREGRLCFALALWNGHDPILKERLFGLNNGEGNHGEDVKECYFYVDSTPTHSYAKAIYKYPHAEFPYAKLRAENARRGKLDPEYELLDTGVFNESRYFDVIAEYAKDGPDDMLIRLTVANRGPEAAPLHVLPTLWFRNTWSWGCTHEGCHLKPRLEKVDAQTVRTNHETLGEFQFSLDAPAPLLFTENETNFERLYQVENTSPYVKDAFHRFVIAGETAAVNPQNYGTKCAPHYALNVAAQSEVVLRFRLTRKDAAAPAPFANFDAVFAARIAEADEFYAGVISPKLEAPQQNVVRQGYAGLLWSKQFYNYVVEDWLDGDPDMPAPPAGHQLHRNGDWRHLFSNDVISMPDKWEYPWFAAWDLAFHMIPFSRIDSDFAKGQLQLFLREWYMHPNGQMPAYEWDFGDVNPPVHAWASWRVYKVSAPAGQRDMLFLERCFQKLLLNFTWWVNRKDIQGRHVFAGGFLGLDNIGLFDRSQPLPNGRKLAQADGTAWMAFYCGTMLAISLELALTNPAYEDIASKFFEHYIQIVDAMNGIGEHGLWDEDDGFYYDQVLDPNDGSMPLRIRSLVGLIPMISVEILEQETIDRLPGFAKRLQWFTKNRPDLMQHISCLEEGDHGTTHSHRLLAVPSRERLEKLLRIMLDEAEFFSPHGLRSLSAAYRGNPYTLDLDGMTFRIDYEPAESTTGLFGGNSNWRGPVWLPINYLIVEALERYHHFYGDTLQVECPTGSGNKMNLQQVAAELARRLASLVVPDENGHRPCMGQRELFATDPHWRDLLLFNEYFHGDTGEGLGASHQTGWTALLTRCLGIVGKISE